jgi:hypothetical protein
VSKSAKVVLVFSVEVPCRPAAPHKQNHFTISPPNHLNIAIRIMQYSQLFCL